MNNAAFDDEQINLSDMEYTALGHDNALMPGVFGGGALELCDHSHELQSMRITIENLRETVDNLTAERDSLKMQLELAEERD